jgi:hypothetical protein
VIAPVVSTERVVQAMLAIFAVVLVMALLSGIFKAVRRLCGNRRRRKEVLPAPDKHAVRPQNLY